MEKMERKKRGTPRETWRSPSLSLNGPFWSTKVNFSETWEITEDSPKAKRTGNDGRTLMSLKLSIS